MGLWYVQTWTVTKGKFDEHEEIMRRMQKDIHERPELDKTMEYFIKQFGPMGGRVMILKFDSLAESENFFAKIDKMENEEDFYLRKEWRECIDYNTWKGFFWVEKPLE